MSRYGFPLYGVPTYGEAGANQLYYDSRILAFVLEYDVIEVRWETIQPNPNDPAPTYWKLIRSQSGVPDDPELGRFLTGGLIDSFSLSYTDRDVVETAGQEVYYSIWVYNGLQWILSGYTAAVVVPQSSTLTHLGQRLPGVWVNQTQGVGDITGTPDPQNSLMKFLSAFAFEYDKIKTQATLVSDISDYSRVPRALLPNAVASVGMVYEPTLGDGINRSLYRVGHKINATKGTLAGIQTYSSALTHWGSSVTRGINLLFDYNDSSFEEGVGGWDVLEGDLEHYLYDEPTLEAPTPSMQDALAPARTAGAAVLYAGANVKTMPDLVGSDLLDAQSLMYSQQLYLEVIPTSAGATEENNGTIKSQAVAAETDLRANTFVSAYIYDLEADAEEDDLPEPEEDRYPPETLAPASMTLGTRGDTRYFAIPLLSSPNEEDRTYVFSFYARHLDDAGEISLGVQWFDKFGETILSQFYNDQPTQTTWYRYLEEFIAPVDAETVALTIIFDAENMADRLLVDMAQFSLKKNGLGFEDARLIKVQVDSDRINYLPNPGFDNSTVGWFANDALLASDREAPTEANIFGIATGRLTVTGTAPALVSDWIHVRPSAPLTFSAYVTGAQAGTAVARIEFTTPQGSAEQISVANGAFAFGPALLDSDEFVVGSDPVRISVTAQSPSFVADNGAASAKVSIYFVDADVDDVFYIDGCMLEQALEVGPYFQGNGGPAPEEPLSERFVNVYDCRWERRAQTNYVTNSYFNDVSGLTATNGTLQSVNATTTVIPLTGSKMLGITRSAAGNVSVSQTVYVEGLSVEETGGEDLVMSVYVNGLSGTVTIGTSSTDKSTFVIDSANADYWTRIWHITRLPADASSVPMLITGTYTGNTFYMDAAMLEYGRIPGRLIDENSGATTRVNLYHPGELIHEAFQDQPGSGRSYYFSHFLDKYERLKMSLDQVMPLGSSWKLINGEPTPDDPGMPTSILVSPSFERSLAGWTSSDGLARIINEGSLFGGKVALHGEAWGEMVLSSGAGEIYSRKSPVVALAGYFLSFGARPTHAGNHTVVAKITWYDSVGISLWEDTHTATVSDETKWSYVGMTAKNVKLIGGLPVTASQASITISVTCPTSGCSTFDVDRVLFRQ